MSDMNTASAVNAMKLIFQNVTWAGIGDATGLVGSTVDGVYYVSLHTGDPGVVGDQTTNEIDYTGYSRVSVVRTSSGWSVSAAAVASNVAAITFGQMTAGAGGTVTYALIGTDASGAGTAVARASGINLAVSVNVTPSFAIGALDFTLT